MTQLFSKILCPVDFDQNSMAALDFATGLAQECNALIYVLHVVRAPFQPSEVPAEPPVQEWEQDAETRLQDVARQRLDGKVKYKVIAKRGNPAAAILEAERELDPDVVVMATHGRTGLGHFVLGSVAEHVVRASRRPVLTVRARENA
jgi:nucleotide-binding universal stress UspA family protein